MSSGSAEVSQPTTVYVFTGQGSQEPGMGIDLYNSSPAARAVWEGADAHLLAVYGFSIVEIVKDNPQDGQGRPCQDLPLFADIDVRTPMYTFSHPNGLLFATQFAQIALVITEKAAFEDMRLSENRSNYAMCAVNPSRILPTFSDAALREVVDSIATISGSLEIVNYNVEASS